ncbi:kinase-like domain-containing protein [Xylaria telfairii]|nr:kinase-like domain-containing protein [Xylaria telfairii]
MSNNEDSESHGVNQSLQHYNVNPGRHGSGTINRVVDYGFHAHARRRQSSTQTLDAKHVALKFQQSNLPNIPPTEQSTTYIDSPQSEYEGLAHELHRAMVDAYPDCNNTFLPLGELERICQESVVRRELKRAFRNSSTKLVESYTKYVCDDSRNPKQRENTSVKLFAILVLMGKLDMIGDLIEAGIKDRHLPLRKSKTKYPSDFMLVKNEITVNGVLEQITCCENWGSNDKNEFYSRQWGLLSPYFDKAEDGSVVLYDLDEQVIMPWTTIGEQAVGGFSDVMHVTIHKDHHAFAAQSFAIKTPSSEDDIPFEDELQTLKKVEERFHLISVYAAYRKGSEHSFILPWADGGTLLDLWNEDPQSLRSKVFVENHEDTEAQREKLVIRWIASQLVGLTGEFGLGFLHDTHFPRSQWDGKLNAVQTERRYGIHSNIKPTNILHFKQDGQISEQHSIKVVRGLGHLKISGFGLTTFHSTLTRQPRTGPRSATYRPPEFGLESALCSEKIDIWSLGCVMLQFLTWFIGGREALAEFNWKRLEETVYNGLKFREDNFFNITKSGGRTHKSSVQNHIEDLQREIGQNNYLHDCLVLIRTKMLQIDPEKRAGFEEISAILQECYEKHEPVENSPPLSVDGESNFAPPSVFSLPDGSIASSVSSQPEILAASFLRDILKRNPTTTRTSLIFSMLKPSS